MNTWLLPPAETETESKLHSFLRNSGSEGRYRSRPLGVLRGMGASATLVTIAALDIRNPERLLRGIQIDVDGLNLKTSAPLGDCGPAFIDEDELDAFIADAKRVKLVWDEGPWPEAEDREERTKTRSGIELIVKLVPTVMRGPGMVEAIAPMLGWLKLGSKKTACVVFHPREITILIGFCERARASMATDNSDATKTALLEADRALARGVDEMIASYWRLREVAHVGLQSLAMEPAQSVGDRVMSAIDVQVMEDLTHMAIIILDADGIVDRAELGRVRRLVGEIVPDARDWGLEAANGFVKSLREARAAKGASRPAGLLQVEAYDVRNGTDLASEYRAQILTVLEVLASSNGIAGDPELNALQDAKRLLGLV